MVTWGARPTYQAGLTAGKKGDLEPPLKKPRLGKDGEDDGDKPPKPEEKPPTPEKPPKLEETPPKQEVTGKTVSFQNLSGGLTKLEWVAGADSVALSMEPRESGKRLKPHTALTY